MLTGVKHTCTLNDFKHTCMLGCFKHTYMHTYSLFARRINKLAKLDRAPQNHCLKVNFEESPKAPETIETDHLEKKSEQSWSGTISCVPWYRPKLHLKDRWRCQRQLKPHVCNRILAICRLGSPAAVRSWGPQKSNSSKFGWSAGSEVRDRVELIY